jgi:hypothetical protein
MRLTDLLLCDGVVLASRRAVSPLLRIGDAGEERSQQNDSDRYLKTHVTLLFSVAW